MVGAQVPLLQTCQESRLLASKKYGFRTLAGFKHPFYSSIKTDLLLIGASAMNLASDDPSMIGYEMACTLRRVARIICVV